MPKTKNDTKTVPYNTPVPVELHRAIQERMASRGFNSKAEYVRALMRADVEGAAQETLEAKLRRALKRGSYKEATPEFWEELRADVLDDD